jgi:hypothetical protein
MLPKKWQNVFPTIYNFSGSSSMTKPKSYVPKERTPAQQAILDKARERAHAVLREKNKIVKSMKTEEEETQEKKEELVEEKQEDEENSSPSSPEPEREPEPEPEPEREPEPEPEPEPVREPVRVPEPEPEAPKFRFDPISGYMLKI